MEKQNPAKHLDLRDRFPLIESSYELERLDSFFNYTTRAKTFRNQPKNFHVILYMYKIATTYLIVDH